MTLSSYSECINFNRSKISYLNDYNIKINAGIWYIGCSCLNLYRFNVLGVQKWLIFR
jgi:hypothetical protein